MLMTGSHCVNMFVQAKSVVYELRMDAAAVPIGGVERATGLTRDALGKWELGAGFPVPERDGLGERLDFWLRIDRLRLIRRLRLPIRWGQRSSGYWTISTRRRCAGCCPGHRCAMV